MTEQAESTAFPVSPPGTPAEHVLMVVPHDHPLLKLKQALPWEEIEQVMVGITTARIAEHFAPDRFRASRRSGGSASGGDERRRRSEREAGRLGELL